MGEYIVFKRTLCALLLAGVGTAAQASEPSGRPNLFAFGVIGGTLGVGGELSILVYDGIVLRANASTYSMDLNETVSSFGGTLNDYNFRANGLFAGGLVDLHPFGSGWRLSLGARYVDLDLKSDDPNNDTDGQGNHVGVSIGNSKYTFAQVGAVHTKVRNKNSTAPYLGFGYDAAHFQSNGVGFSLGFDLGAIYAGDPEVKITTDKSNVPGLVTDIALEEEKLKSEIRKWYNFYPVLMLSGKVSF